MGSLDRRLLLVVGAGRTVVEPACVLPQQAEVGRPGVSFSFVPEGSEAAARVVQELAPSGSDAEIAKAAQGYRVYYQAHIDGRTDAPEGYSVDHTGNIYLMGPDGKFVAYYSPGIVPDELAADLMRRVTSG